MKRLTQADINKVNKMEVGDTLCIQGIQIVGCHYRGLWCEDCIFENYKKCTNGTHTVWCRTKHMVYHAASDIIGEA